MSSFTSLSNTAINLITRFGTTINYIQKSNGVYNPAIGEMQVVEKVIPVKAAILDLTLQSNGNTYRNGTMIESGDKQVLIIPPERLNEGIETLKINPVSDYLQFGNQNWKIVTYKETNPSLTENVYIECYVRKA